MDTLTNEISSLLNEKSELAKQLKKQYVFYWKTGLNFAVFAALLFSINSSLTELNESVKMVLSIAEVLLLIGAVGVITIVKNKNIKFRSINARVESERLRVMKTFANGNIPIKKLLSSGIAEKNDVGSIDSRLDELEDEMIKKHTKIIDIATASDKLRQLIIEQIDYHQGANRIMKYETKLENAEMWLKYLSWVFYLGVFIHLFHAIHLLPHFIPESIGLLCCAIVAPVYAWFEGQKYFEEWERFLGESLIMKEYFQVQLIKLDAQPENLTEFAHGIREVMDRENRTWKILMEFKSMKGI